VASIQELKQQIDLHDLASRLGLKRPHERGNYQSPNGTDKNPSLQIYPDGKAFKDYKADVGGSCVDFIIHVEQLDPNDVAGAMRRLHEIYNIPFDKPNEPQPKRERTKTEFIADQCMRETTRAVEYLIGRGVPDETLKWAVARGALGYNEWTSSKIESGQPMHGGPAAAFICRDFHTGSIRAVDFRYLDPEINGGIKTKSTGDKEGVPWFIERPHLERARTVYIVESAINALCVEACKLPLTAAMAIRGTGTWRSIDWRILQGKQVVLALDADQPDDKGFRPGAKASWGIYDVLAGLNISALFVDQRRWYEDGHNDIADIAKAEGIEALRERLREFEPWVIQGMPGKDAPMGKARVFLPAHDFSVYWRYRAKADFTTFVTKVEQDGEEGAEQLKFEDTCGFRVAALSRVTIQSATATMSGEGDSQPTTIFAVSVQTPRHGSQLVRRVFTDERLHNIEHWKKFGPVFSPMRFLRLVNILERSADCGSRDALNFVGLAWRDGKTVVNEGPDCYFTEPEKQCPYHNLTFPSGTPADARRVISAYQETFKDNAAALLLAWSLGCHLKAYTGFWPHIIMQADKGSGKSTLIKRLERTIGMTMFGGQSLQTEFRLLTSVSHTSHPVGWEEISARRQDVINVAVAMLQESYQHTVTRRGSDLTEFMISAPVLLAGEDVPVKSLTGKVIRTELTGRKGDQMPENLPKFPVRQWLEFLAAIDRERIAQLLKDCEASMWKACRAKPGDTGAARMVRNYAAIAMAWGLLCEFADVPVEQGDFWKDLRTTMNAHIKETSGDREPWVWILERAISEIESHQFTYPYTFGVEDAEQCLIIRPSHIMDHLSSTSRLRDEFNALPVKSGRIFKRQLDQAGVIVKDGLDKRINSHRHAHLSAISLERLQEFGLHLSVPDEPTQTVAPFGAAANE
jgi:hypothetical protein